MPWADSQAATASRPTPQTPKAKPARTRSTAPLQLAMVVSSMSTGNRRAKASSRMRTGWQQAKSHGYRQRSAGSGTSSGSYSSNSNRQRPRTPRRSQPRSPQHPKHPLSPRHHHHRPQSRSSPSRTGKRPTRSTGKTSPESSSSTEIQAPMLSSRSSRPRDSMVFRLLQRIPPHSPPPAKHPTLSPSVASVQPTEGH